MQDATRSLTLFARLVRGFLVAALACVPTWLVGCDSEVESQAGSETLRFADTGVEGMEELRRSFGPFVAELEKATGYEIEFFPVSNRSIAALALERGQVDLVLTGPTEYLFMRSRMPVHPIAGIERPNYASIFVVPADSDARSLADLRGKTIAMKETGSTSGHVAPSVMLLDAGLDLERDVTIRMLSGARFEALLSGEVDALATGKRDWETLVRRAGEGELRILAESDPLPRDLIIARGDLPERVVRELRSALTEHSDALIGAMMQTEEREKYTGSRLRPADDADYDEVRRMHKLLDLPYDH